MKPIYTIYESKLNDENIWEDGKAIGVTLFSSKTKARKAMRARYETMEKRGADASFYEKSGLQEPYYEFDRNGNRFMHYIVQCILV